MFPSLTNCDIDGGLPCNEVIALTTVLRSLKFNSAPSITRSYCTKQGSYDAIAIDCKCSPNAKGILVCHIRNITIQNSYLSGQIDMAITNLTNLEKIDLSNNQLKGPIPAELSNLSSLTELTLRDNQLTGPIPDGLGVLKQLTTLDLALNYLTGEIPPSLGGLSSLTYLSLDSNLLSGQVPPQLGNLSKLVTLKLNENNLYGELPPELGHLRYLQSLLLTSNQFTGNLSETYSGLTSLKVLAIGGNNISGPIPKYISSWSSLLYLNLLGNNFDELPLEILNMSSLQVLLVSDLKNKGFSFPESANLSNIYRMTLRNCKIYDKIPDYIGNWTSLSYLDLSLNDLTGGIPSTLKNLSLQGMFLTGNKLNGPIPSWISDTLTYGDLSYNNFTNYTTLTDPTNQNLSSFIRNRQLPEEKLTNLTFLDPKRINIEPTRTFLNKLIKSEQCGGKKKYHSLFINSGGKATTFDRNQYDADTNVSNFYLSPEKNWGYSCSGDINSFSSTANSSDYVRNMSCGVSVPEAVLFENARYCPTSLRYYGFCLRNGKYTVSLHFSESMYAKDEDHSSTGKRVFDIYIQGKRVVGDFNIKKEAGGPNKNLTRRFSSVEVHNHSLKIHLLCASRGSLNAQPFLNGPLISAVAVAPEFKVGKLSPLAIAGIVVSALLAPLLLFLFLWRMGLIGNRDLYATKIEIRDKSYTVKQLIDATKNFSIEIGKGRFGVVYKAELPDKVSVAVKKLSTQPEQDNSQIVNEVYLMRTLKHKNLLELFDGYSKSNLHLLIYEYAQHKSIEQALQDPNAPVDMHKWRTRYDICLGIAEGLKYLHDSVPKIIHSNVSASNIMIDSNLNAKVSDFALAKFYDVENKYIPIGAGEKLAYMAPEYVKWKKVTEKVDVYSYGVVLLQIISGKKNAESKLNQETVFLLETAWNWHKKGKILDLVDERLFSDPNYTREEARTILNLAMVCLHASPELRPTMSKIVSDLKDGKNKWDPVAVIPMA